MAHQSKKGHRTRQKILEVATELFHKNGTNATSVDQILAESGAGKSQFYYHFKSKEVLIQAVLRWHREQFCQEENPFSQPIQSWKDLENWCNVYVDMLKSFKCQRGCPIATIASDLKDSQEQTREITEMIMDTAKDHVRKFFEQRQSQGKFSNICCDSLSEFVITSIQGGILLTKIRQNVSPILNTIDHLIQYLKSLE